MTRVFLDTNIFVYALGRDHSYREPCRMIIERLRRGQLEGETSVQVVAEFLYIRGRRANDYREAGERAEEISGLVNAVHDVGPADLKSAIATLIEHPKLQPNDALHAAVALNRGIGSILTADRSLGVVDGLTRVDPLDEVAVESLLAEPG